MGELEPNPAAPDLDRDRAPAIAPNAPSPSSSSSSPPPSHSSSPPSAAEPPGLRNLAKWSIVTLVAIALLGALRAWWGYESHRRLSGYLAEAKARGERVVVEDFMPRAISDDRNAAVAYQRAMKGIVLSNAEKMWQGNWGQSLPPSDADRALIASIVARNAQPLADARAARAMPEVEWDLKWRRPAYATVLPLLNSARTLASVLEAAALDAHLRGDGAAALEHLLDLLHLARSIARYGPGQVSQLVSFGIDATACRVLIQVAPGAAAYSAARPPSPATRAAALALVTRLLDERALAEGVAAAYRVERMLVLDGAAAYLRQSGQPAAVAWLLQPMTELDTLRAAERSTKLAAAALEQPTFPAARDAAPRRVDLNSAARVHVAVRAFSGTMMPSDAAQLQHYRALATRRAAAIALAAGVYAIDHGGRSPASLDALVPGYLPRVPRDPFAPTERPMTYRPSPPATRPFVYSVGEDGTDEGGSTRGLQAQDPKRWATLPWQTQDAVFPIGQAEVAE